MSQEWIISVLKDLKNFANQNQLGRLAEQLDDTIHVAVAETTTKARNIAAAEGDAKSNRDVSRTRGAM
ncbi:hypothetical protein GCM10011498_25770 [Amylibacter cionae]|uniref:Uncharacterized protein n=1 Tax=Neptunicoccus cionae TaxID=2035344 RepID=A0A916R000_9RHOB|nr:hypothetical protein GCM10011498_25770 [Amylibacter cionae]